jgi:Ca-activated chloride channel homolog
MTRTAIQRLAAFILAVGALATTAANAQHAASGEEAFASLGRCSQIIMVPGDCFPITRGRPGVRVESIGADVKIIEQAATTTLDISVVNTSGSPEEGVLLLPVPDGAVVNMFMFDGASNEAVAKVLPRDEARRLYDAIVAKVRDPALLEFAGYNLIRSSVFPVPAHGRQRLRLTYETILSAEGQRVDYILPRSESLQQNASWTVAVDVKAKSPIATVYSPTHSIAVSHVDPRHVAVKLNSTVTMQPGAFRLSYLIQREDLSASLMAYPDPSVGGGYFLLMAALAPENAAARPKIIREVTLVIDKSGSMAGEKMDQAKAAALMVLEGIEDGESFNIIDYSNSVSSFAEKPVVKNRQTLLEARTYIHAIKPTGGTNIHDALLESLRPVPAAGSLPIVLFLTDGLPTVGRTSEVDIRKLVETGNKHRRRVFTFGVGNDVNVPLLDRVADLTRAVGTYVLPHEDVEVKVGAMFKRLSGPVLADIRITVRDASGNPSTRLITETIPSAPPDLFDGDQLILVGQYHGEQPVTFQIDGHDRGRDRTFSFSFDLSNATTKNAFVPRLWASRRIAYLIDQIRQAGAEAGLRPAEVGASIHSDPRFRELTEEILRLSTQFGILTEYTAFLATDGTDLGNWGGLTRGCSENLDSRAVRSRSGAAAVNQGINFNRQKEQKMVQYDNFYVDDKLNRVEITSVQQVCDRAFFNRGDRWIDSGIVLAKGDLEPDQIVIFGSDEHLQILRELEKENRAGILSLRGEILILHHGRRILITNPC